MMRAACLALLPTLLAVPLHAATFTVHDVRSAREISEATELYVDDRLVATFRLDADRREILVTVQVPARRDAAGHDAGGHEQHAYALCGTITIRSEQGTPEIHEVNATGLLHEPDHHGYEALGAEDFNLFYLSDPGDPAAADSVRQRSGLCRAPIS